MSKNHHRPRPLRRDMLGKGADKKGAALAGLVTAILLLAGCYTYVPMRPVTTPMPTSDSGLACWRQCMGTVPLCENGCRAQGVFARPAVEHCKDRCADSRDACLNTCPH